jgi:hypothetical protein
MKNFLQFDDIFTYWIDAWFFLHLFFQSTIVSPLLAAWISLIVTLVGLIGLFILNGNMMRILKLMLMTLVVKIIPLYILTVYLKEKIDLYRDISWLIVVFIVYNFYLLIKGTNIYVVYLEIINSNREDKKNTLPFFRLLDYLSNQMAKN